MSSVSASRPSIFWIILSQSVKLPCKDIRERMWPLKMLHRERVSQFRTAVLSLLACVRIIRNDGARLLLPINERGC